MRRLFLLALVVLASPVLAQAGGAQRGVREGYGSSLDLPTLPDAGRGAVSRLNTRVPNRINNRLNLRIGRYRVRASDPVAALRPSQDDGSRYAPNAQPASARR